MALHLPPSGFVSRLKTYDPKLRVRWADRGGYWRIERHIRPERINLDPALFSDPEDYVTAKEGHCLIMRVPQDMLDNRVFETLWAGDIQRRGGGDKVATEVENAYTERMAKAEQQWGEFIEQAALERIRYMNRVRTLSEKHAHTAPVGGMSING